MLRQIDFYCIRQRRGGLDLRPDSMPAVRNKPVADQLGADGQTPQRINAASEPKQEHQNYTEGLPYQGKVKTAASNNTDRTAEPIQKLRVSDKSKDATAPSGPKNTAGGIKHNKTPVTNTARSEILIAPGPRPIGSLETHALPNRLLLHQTETRGFGFET